GVDSGLSHLAGALGVPTLVIYGSTDPVLTGCVGARARNLRADFPCAPCRSRHCAYRGAPATFDGEAVAPACYGRVGPDRVLAALASL
ncbi:MAG: glycosyltransferase family 9 protein, partial [Myxococcales bacterium]